MTAHEDRRARPAPWQIGRPQPAVRALADAGALAGRFLDVGCGTGEHALLAAVSGAAEVTAVDIDENALGTAQERARERGLSVVFLHGDVRELAASGIGVFDVLLDSLVLHAIPEGSRAAYGRALADLGAPGGRLYVVGYGAAQADVPHHLEPDAVRAALAPWWHLDDAAAIRIDTRIHPDGARGWLFALTRTRGAR